VKNCESAGKALFNPVRRIFLMNFHYYSKFIRLTKDVTIQYRFSGEFLMIDEWGRIFVLKQEKGEFCKRRSVVLIFRGLK